MRNKTIRYAIAVGALLSSCNVVNHIRNKYYTKISSTKFTELLAKPGMHVDTLVLDASFELYVRQVCRPRPAARFYGSGDPTLTSSLERCNCEDPTNGYNKEKLELEYLLVSKNRFVYITTVPPKISRGNDGKVIMRYDRPLYKVDNFVNVEAFNTFFFGDRLGDEFLLNPVVPPSNGPERWLYSRSADGNVLTIDAVVQQQKGYSAYSFPDQVLALPLRFYRKTDWSIGISQNDEAATLTGADAKRLRRNTVYLVHNSKALDKIVFVFDKPFDDNFTGLYFSGDRAKAVRR